MLSLTTIWANVLAAAEVAPAVSTADNSSTLWTVVIGAAIAVIPTLLLAFSGWLRKLLGISETPTLTPATSDITVEQAKDLMLDRVRVAVYNASEHWLLTQIPAIIKDATDADGFQWENHWASLRAYAVEAGKSFLANNKDSIEYFIDNKEVETIVDQWLVRMISQLPEVIVKLLPEDVSKQMIAKAREFLAANGKMLIAHS